VLPETDSAGRRVIFYYKAVSEYYKERENLLRSFWYVANVISRNEDVQKLGIVNVEYNLGGFPKHGMDYEKSRRFAKLFRAVPIRFNSFYPCLDEIAWITVVETFSVMISRFLRIRLGVITGNRDEVLLKLASLGVPSMALPINENNELLKDSHLQWVETLEAAVVAAAKERTKDESNDDDNNKGTPPDLKNEETAPQVNAITDLIDATSAFYALG